MKSPRIPPVLVLVLPGGPGLLGEEAETDSGDDGAFRRTGVVTLLTSRPPGSSILMLRSGKSSFSFFRVTSLSMLRWSWLR